MIWFIVGFLCGIAATLFCILTFWADTEDPI